MTGRMLNERARQVVVLVMFIGFNVTFFVQHALGLSGMPRRIYTYQPGLGWSTYNLISTIGSFILARRHPDDGHQHRARAQARHDRGAGPVEGQHARVVHALAAAGQQLRRDPARALGRADARHPPRRSSARPASPRRPAAASGSPAWSEGRGRPASAGDLVGVDAGRERLDRAALAAAARGRSWPTTSTLTKPKVQSLLLFTTVTTMEIAGNPPRLADRADLPGRLPVGRRRRRRQPLLRPRHRRPDGADREPADPRRARVAPARR